MEDLDVRSVLPILHQFGINIDQLGPEKLEDLMKLCSKIKNPSEITPEISKKLLEILGINTRGVSKPKNRATVKIGRNEVCPCGKTGKKYKNCCGSNVGDLKSKSPQLNDNSIKP
jgi:hypothetical protein